MGLKFKNWSAEVRNMFYYIAINECFDKMHVCPIKGVSGTLKDDFQLEWPDKVVEKVKRCTYKQFKTHLA